MLSVGSLCTGYGGLEMGLETVHGDIDLRFVSDIDKDVNTLLAHYHPNTPNLGDLTAVKWADIEPVDVLCAGYPCQPFSTAGKRKGLEDERAIFEYIADAISVLRPRNVLLENVAGHLTLGGTAVIATLAKLGYSSRWGIVRASDAASPHKRARRFIWCEITDASSITGWTGHFKATQQRQTQEWCTGQFQPCGSSCINAYTKSGNATNKKQYSMETTTRQTAESGECDCAFGQWQPAIERWAEVLGRQAPQPQHGKGVSADFVEGMMGLPEGYVTDIGLSRQAQLKILGNGVVPQQAALALQLLAEGGYYPKTA